MTRWTAILLLTFAPSTVCAQEAPQGWLGLATPGLPTVYVVDETGVETSGTFLRVTPDSLVLLVHDAELQFEAARVRRIQKRGDSLRNGALIGAVVGVGMGLIAAGISDCPGEDPGGRCPAFRVGTLLGSTAGYAAIGVGIDALVVGRTTLYERPVAAPRSAAPAFQAGTAITLRFRW